MKPSIKVDRQHLYYTDGTHELTLGVAWSGMSKTADCPIGFEIDARDLATWAKPAGEVIDSSTRERVLDEIADYYSKGPIADIIGKRGALLRAASPFRFSL